VIFISSDGGNTRPPSCCRHRAATATLPLPTPPALPTLPLPLPSWPLPPCRHRASAATAVPFVSIVIVVAVIIVISVLVETKSHGNCVPSRSRAFEYTGKNVTWKDTLFPRQQPISSPSPRTAK